MPARATGSAPRIAKEHFFSVGYGRKAGSRHHCNVQCLALFWSPIFPPLELLTFFFPEDQGLFYSFGIKIPSGVLRMCHCCPVRRLMCNQSSNLHVQKELRLEFICSSTGSRLYMAWVLWSPYGDLVQSTPLVGINPKALQQDGPPHLSEVSESQQIFFPLSEAV